MVSSFNDKMRERIFKNNSYKAIFSFLSRLNEEQKDYVLGLMLSDYYKLNFYKNTICDNEEKLGIFKFPIYELIEELKEEIFLNYNFLPEVISCSKEFHNLDFISKSLIMEVMADYGQDYFLNNINELHILDKITYQVVYDFDIFKEYYKDYIEKNNEQNNKSSKATLFILVKIVELREIDYNKYKRYVLECIKGYYKWKLFLIGNNKSDLLLDEDYIYLDKIKNYSLNNIIEELEKDHDFFFTVVGEHMHYSTVNKEIKENEVDNYLINNTDIEFQKKLKIKRDLN